MKALLIASVILAFTSALRAQVAINSDGSPSDSSAILDIKSDGKGFLPPRMTFNQRNAIQDPVEGLIVICTNCSPSGTGVLSVYQGNKWLNYELECTKPDHPYEADHVPQVTRITWNWDTVFIAKGYKFNTVENYTTAINVGTATSFSEDGLICWTLYNRYIWAYNDCGPSRCGYMTETTLPGTFTAPTAGTHIPGNYQIIWNWQTVTGAVAYKWNTVNNYTTAQDLGTSFSINEYGLYCGVDETSYVWAYDTCGISEATALTATTISCPPECLPFTDPRNGKYYNTVLIGEQCWMRENLDYGIMINNSIESSNNDTVEKYCYNNNDSLCAIYGGLFKWDEMMQYMTTEGIQGICPDGWHLPTDGEWSALSDFLGGDNIAGGKLIEAGTAHWHYTSEEMTNESAFTALPGGYRYFLSGFDYLGTSGYFWTSSNDGGPVGAYFRQLNMRYEKIIRQTWSKNYGYSVRCIKDD
jgi:uncharacterized protein (TIGR02145 family)